MTYITKQKAAVGSWFDEAEDANPVVGIDTVYDNLKAILTGTAAAAVPASEGNLNVSASGGTSISAEDFVPGSCKPRNFVALNYVKTLQGQLNRIAAAKGFAKIGVDGQIGPSALGLLKKVQAAFPAIMGDTSSCLYVSADADVIGGQVKDVADSIGAPAVAPPSSKAATIVTKSGMIVTPPGAPAASVMDVFSGVSPLQGIALAGIAGGIGYLLLRKKRKKGKR